jgi:hypothetical protein
MSVLTTWSRRRNRSRFRTLNLSVYFHLSNTALLPLPGHSGIKNDPNQARQLAALAGGVQDDDRILREMVAKKAPKILIAAKLRRSGSAVQARTFLA